MSRQVGAAVVALAVFAVGCGGHSGSVGQRSSSRTARNAGPTAPAPSAFTTTQSVARPAAHRSGPILGHPAASGSTLPTGTPSSRASASKAPPAAAPSRPRPVVAGTYTYRQSGTEKYAGSSRSPDPTGTLVVAPAGADGRQRSSRRIDGDQPPSDTTTACRPDGIFIVAATQRARVPGRTVAVSCTFEPGVPAPPWPPAVGKTFAADGDCGDVTVHVSGRISGMRSASVGGSAYQVYVVDSTLTTTGTARSTTHGTDWFAPDLRLTVHSVSTTSGTYGLAGFSSSLTSDLLSARPS